MEIDRSRRLAFEEVAELYNESRPGYPDELVKEILDLSSLPPDGRILEVGPGPGNATVLFAQRGYQILGIELGARLAQFARERCRDFPNVTVVHSTFEEYPLEPSSFDLAISADAFHWIPPQIGYPKLAAALKQTGSAALFWHLPLNPQAAWSVAVDEIYHRLAPQFPDPRWPDLDALVDIICENFRTSERFGGVTIKSYKWSEVYTTEKMIKLLATRSSYRGMSPELRSSINKETRLVLDSFGGQVEKSFHVVLFHARLK